MCLSEADGNRTRNLRIDSPVLSSLSTDANPSDGNGLANEASGARKASAADSAALSPNSVLIDPDLQAIIDVWPALAESTKTKILRLIV